MISHEYRCIFIHIPRCAGTSVETWMTGQDWWQTDRSTKHMLASQAKRAYAIHWASYYKFALVRDPYLRTASCLSYAGHFGLKRTENFIDFKGYHQRFGSKIVVEHDYRFADREDLLRPSHTAGAIYGNILDEPLDFIGHFETLAKDMDVVRHELKIPRPFTIWKEQSKVRADEIELSARDRKKITALYRKDFHRFGYTADPAS
jgi:hypothetical protein